jgi:cytochrome c553
MRIAGLLTFLALGAALAGGNAAAQDTFNVDEAVEVCAACHGEDGIPIEPDYPILWGQQYYYLYVQMKDYKAGRRASEIMQPIASELTKDQMKALATYFAAKTWPEIPIDKDSAKANSGQTQTGAGQCSQCHNTYMGDSRLPRVAGQQEAYLLRTMQEFKNKVRLNSAAKGSLMKSYDDTSIEELAHFLATL